MEPKTLVELIDDFAKVRTARLDFEAKARKLAPLEEIIHTKIVEFLRARDETTGSSSLYSIEMEKKEVPKCEDWNKFYAYISANNAYDLLHKRITDTAVVLRWNESVVIPGVVKFPVFKLKLSEL